LIVNQFIVGFGLFMGFVGHKKNIEYHKTYGGLWRYTDQIKVTFLTAETSV